MKGLIVIKKDVFNISKRLKAIDKNYILVRNIKNHCFEVHYKKVGNLQLKVPYDNLDYKTLTLTLKTRVDNINLLIQQIDKHNEELMKQQMEKSINKLII